MRSYETPTGPHLTVLTYNVNYGGPRPDLALQAILNADADIVCLQETTPGWEAFLRLRLQDRYPHALFHTQPAAGGMGVFSREPIEETAWIPSPAGWFPGWILKAATPVGPVQILAVHLHPAVTEDGRFTLGAFMSTGALRMGELKAYHARLDPALPTLAMGDFNEGDGGEMFGWLKERGLTDALPEFDRAANTWEWKTTFLTLAKRLDHILYTRPLYCLESRVLREGASDHFPLRAVFERRDGHDGR